MQMGMQFLSGLAQTLADPKATQDLVESITETDEETGETYVKIPVQGKDLVQNAFKALGAFFQGKGWLVLSNPLNPLKGVLAISVFSLFKENLDLR